MADQPTAAPKDLIGFLDYYLVQKAPFQLPNGFREFLVQYGPWITVVLLVLSLPLLLVALGLSAVFLPFAGVAAPGLAFSWLFLFVQLGLMAAALPGLFARRMSGWRLLFYGDLASIVFSLMRGQIFAAIIGGVIGLYLLFQVRTLYKE